MKSVLVFSGSPRKRGNTDILSDAFLKGAIEAGAEAEKIRLYSLKISPCIECGGCDDTGKCVIRDDMEDIYRKLGKADIIAVSSPIFFYNITSLTQALVERSQALWVSKYVLEKGELGGKLREGIFLSLGATKGRLLFDGSIRVMRYFFDAVSGRLTAGLFFRGIEKKGAILEHPSALESARDLGRAIVSGLDLSTIENVWLPGGGN